MHHALGTTEDMGDKRWILSLHGAYGLIGRPDLQKRATEGALDLRLLLQSMLKKIAP